MEEAMEPLLSEVSMLLLPVAEGIFDRDGGLRSGVTALMEAGVDNDSVSVRMNVPSILRLVV